MARLGFEITMIMEIRKTLPSLGQSGVGGFPVSGISPQEWGCGAPVLSSVLTHSLVRNFLLLQRPFSNVPSVMSHLV